MIDAERIEVEDMQDDAEAAAWSARASYRHSGQRGVAALNQQRARIKSVAARAAYLAWIGH